MQSDWLLYVVVAIFALGFILGYGLRETISRRRRQRARLFRRGEDVILGRLEPPPSRIEGALVERADEPSPVLPRAADAPRMAEQNAGSSEPIESSSSSSRAGAPLAATRDTG